jgi:hypothetical protein
MGARAGKTDTPRGVGLLAVSEPTSDPLSNERLVRGFVGWLRRSRLLLYAGIGVVVVIAVSIAAALLSAYHDHVTASRFASVRIGMSLGEVRSIMGAPTPDDVSRAGAGISDRDLKFALNANGYTVTTLGPPHLCWLYGGASDRPTGRLVCFSRGGHVIQIWSRPDSPAG